MSILPSDLTIYAAVQNPTNDSDPAGGGIDLATQLTLADMSTTPQAARLVSTDAADTNQQYTLTGIDANANPLTETLTLNGQTPVAGSEVFAHISRLAKVAGSALAGVAVLYRAGSATVSSDSLAGQPLIALANTADLTVGDTVIVAPAVSARRQLARIVAINPGVSVTLDTPLTATHTAAAADTLHVVMVRLPGASHTPTQVEVTAARAVFAQAAADPLQVRTYYEKLFARNNNPQGKTLTAARLRLADGPTSATPQQTVNADSFRGSTTLYINATTGLSVGDDIVIAGGTPRAETATIAAIDPGVSLSLAGGLAFTHSAAAADTVELGKVAFALAETPDDAATSTNRQTPPIGVAFATGTLAISPGHQPANTAQGLWLRLRLPLGDGPFRGAVAIQHLGQSW